MTSISPKKSYRITKVQDAADARVERRCKEAQQVSLSPLLNRINLGVVWWVDPPGWKAVAGFGTSPHEHPGLVLDHAHKRRGRIVKMAPGTTKRHQEWPGIFYPRFPYSLPNGKKDGGCYILSEMCDVDPYHISRIKGTLDNRDISRLKNALSEKAWKKKRYGRR